MNDNLDQHDNVFSLQILKKPNTSQILLKL